MLIATLDVALRGDTGQLDTSLDKSSKKVQQFAKNTSKAGGGSFGANLGGALAPLTSMASSALGPISGLASAALGPLGAVAAAAAAAALAIGSIAASARSGIGELSSLGRQAQTLGITTSALAGLHHAGAMAGLDSGEVDHFVKNFQKHVAEAKAGGGELGIAFKRIGLDVQSISELPLEEAIGQFGDALKNVGSQADRIQIAEKISRGGAQLLPFLTKGSEGIKEAIGQAAKLGPTSQAAVAQIQGTVAAGRQFEAALGGIGRSLAVTFGPAIESVAGWVSEVATSFAEFASDRSNIAFFQLVTEVIMGVGKALLDLGVWLLKTTTLFGPLVTAANESGMTWSAWRDLLTDAFTVGRFVIANFADYAKLYFDKAKLSLVTFGNDVSNLFTNVLPAALSAFGDALSDLAGGKWDGIADRFAAKIKEAFARPRTELETALKGAINKQATRLQDDLNDAVRKKRQEMLDNMPGADKQPGKGEGFDAVTRKSGAYEAGSKEAFSVLYGTQSAQDKALDVANDQLKENKKMARLLDALVQRMRDPVVLKRGRL